MTHQLIGLAMQTEIFKELVLSTSEVNRISMTKGAGVLDDANISIAAGITITILLPPYKKMTIGSLFPVHDDIQQLPIKWPGPIEKTLRVYAPSTQDLLEHSSEIEKIFRGFISSPFKIKDFLENLSVNSSPEYTKELELMNLQFIEELFAASPSIVKECVINISLDFALYDKTSKKRVVFLINDWHKFETKIIMESPKNLPDLFPDFSNN